MTKKAYKKPQITREELEAALIKANDALWQANQKLEEEEKTRMELLSNLSHDLRSPVAALASCVEVLKSGEATKDQQEIFALMERRLKTLQTMINDLFLLTTVESPTTELHTKPIEAGVFLEEFFFSCEADPKYSRRRLVLQVPDSFTYPIAIDAQKMARVLDNLFTNALRYSKDGDEIHLGAAYMGGAFSESVSDRKSHNTHTAKCMVQAGEGQQEGFGTYSANAQSGNVLADTMKEQWENRNAACVEIWVEDTGDGISEQDLPHIFERSYRASRSRTPGDGGSGLGLSIAKGIVKKHGGSIRCESTQGKGSRFTILLPVA